MYYVLIQQSYVKEPDLLAEHCQKGLTIKAFTV